MAGETVATIEPEREMIRRALPLSIPAVVIAVVIGGLLGGRYAAVSAVIGVAVVFLNFIVHGLSLNHAAQISLTALYAAGLFGFVVRLGVIFVIMILLNQLAWFSPVAFAAAVIPCTIVLLVFEMKQLSGRMQVDLWTFPSTRNGRTS
jgi:hypothetical protein